MEYKDPGRYIPIIYLLYSCGSRFGVPSRVPLQYSTHIKGMNTAADHSTRSGCFGASISTPLTIPHDPTNPAMKVEACLNYVL